MASEAPRQRASGTERALLDLTREVASATSEEQLVALVASGIQGLFPGQPFAIRIIDSANGALTSFYAEGPLEDVPRDVLVLRRTAVEKMRLEASRFAPGKVHIVDGEVPHLFCDTSQALSAPLAASGQLFGELNLEYLAGQDSDVAADERLLSQLANHVAVAVRNAKLIAELTLVRNRLADLLENANALIVVAHRDRRVQVFNQAFSNLTGLSKDEVNGRDFLNLVPESEAPRVLGVFADSLRGERVHFETQVRAPNGREARVALATSCVLNAEGEVEGLIAVGQDLTAVRELERRVVQAEKLSSLGKLAASVVHEINNPMTAIHAYSSSLLEHAAPSEEREKLQRIVENAQRIHRFTSDLVAYARPAPDKPQPVAVVPMLSQAVGFCEHLLAEYRVGIERTHEDVPPVLGIGSHLVQVFVNLLTNAVHATAPGGIVKLVTRVEDGRVLIRVEDNGSGIEPSNIKRIFEPFFTTKPEGRGSGLGLSIVLGIVEKHGGRIDVVSEWGKGTTFSVRLPLPTQ
ncbi:MAG: ATP-binding protein [Myxococcaceae bacterium]